MLTYADRRAAAEAVAEGAGPGGGIFVFYKDVVPFIIISVVEPMGTREKFGAFAFCIRTYADVC
jgi:hypothetical protein